MYNHLGEPFVNIKERKGYIPYYLPILLLGVYIRNYVQVHKDTCRSTLTPTTTEKQLTVPPEKN